MDRLPDDLGKTSETASALSDILVRNPRLAHVRCSLSSDGQPCAGFSAAFVVEDDEVLVVYFERDFQNAPYVTGLFIATTPRKLIRVNTGSYLDGSTWSYRADVVDTPP